MSTTPASAVAADAAHERSYDVPGLLEELGTDDFPQAVHAAYWLGVNRAHARALDREVRYARDETYRAQYAKIRDHVAAQAESALCELKAALAAEDAAEAEDAGRHDVGPVAPPSRRIVAEFDCGVHARDYAKAHGYTVTAGVNRLFAVREVTP